MLWNRSIDMAWRDMMRENAIIASECVWPGQIVSHFTFPLFFDASFAGFLFATGFSLYFIGHKMFHKNPYFQFSFGLCDLLCKWIESELNWHIHMVWVGNCDVYLLCTNRSISSCWFLSVCLLCVCRVSLPSNGFHWNW